MQKHAKPCVEHMYWLMFPGVRDKMYRVHVEEPLARFYACELTSSETVWLAVDMFVYVSSTDLYSMHHCL